MNPRSAGPDCSNCGEKVPKELSTRIHCCEHCGIMMDRDVNPGMNIKNRAVGHWVLKARGVRRSTGTLKGKAHTIASA